MVVVGAEDETGCGQRQNLKWNLGFTIYDIRLTRARSVWWRPEVVDPSAMENRKPESPRT